jgi:hypothetical protein
MTTSGPARRPPWRPIALVAAVFALVALGVAAVLAGSGSLGGSDRPGDGSRDAAMEPSPAAEPAEEPLGVDRLLLATEVARSLPGRTWRVTGTDDNTRGNGLRAVCQQARFADPAGMAALVRTTAAQGVPVRRLVQSVERSRSPAGARAAYDTVVGWFAGCRTARLQLLGSHRVDGVGNRAMVMVLRRAGDPPEQYGVGVVQARELTSTVVLRQDGPEAASPRQAARLLAQAASRLCPEDAPRCASSPRVRPVAPPPSGEAPGTLGVVDLPAVGGVRRPWFGVDPVTARRTNPAQTVCDQADFSGTGVTRVFARTYLIPGAALPARFGLAQTVAVFRTAHGASRFLDDVRQSVADCGERELSVTVIPGPDVDGRRTERVSWTLDTEVAEDRSVRLRVGFVRSGRNLAQLTFAPGDTDDMTDRDFDALLVRAGERLGELG